MRSLTNTRSNQRETRKACRERPKLLDHSLGLRLSWFVSNDPRQRPWGGENQDSDRITRAPPSTMLTQLLERSVVQAGLAIVVLLILIATAFWLLARYRDYAAQDRQDAQEVFANLREMHLRGDITEEEFRTIQARTSGSTGDAADQSDSQASPATARPQST